MKKIFVILLAIILGFLVFTGVSSYKKGGSFLDINFSEISETVKNKVTSFKESRKNPEIIINEDNINITEVETEPTLSYSERIEKGDYFFERGFLSFAINEYVKAANLDPDRSEPYLRLLKANYELGDYTKAKRNADIIIKLDPNNYQGKFSLIQIYIKQSDFESAESLIDQLMTSEIEDPNLNYYRALLKIAFNEHDEAKKIIKTLKVGLTDTELNEKLDKFLTAYQEFDFAQAGEEVYLAELLSRSFNQVGEYEMAIYKLKEILKQRGDLRDSWVLLGFAYLNLEKSYFALTAFEKAYDLDSEWPATQYFLGLTYTELSRTEDAVIFFNYALSNGFEPEIVIYRKLADLYLDLQKYQESVDAYERVLDITNEDIDSFIRPIWIYLDYLQKPEEALKLAKIAHTTFPDNPLTYNLLGWSYLGLKNYTEAEKQLTKAIELNPDMAAAHYNLGNLYLEKEDNEKALKMYQKAYELDQNGSIGNLAAKKYNELLSQ